MFRSMQILCEDWYLFWGAIGCSSFGSMQASRARLFKEYKEVQREKSADPDIQLVCDDSNIFKWTALIKVGDGYSGKKNMVL